MKGSFRVSSVKEMRGFVQGYERYPNRYNGNRLVSYSNEAKCLLVRGELDGKDTSFFSPSVTIRTTTGMLNFKSMDDNSWFELIEGEKIMARMVDPINRFLAPLRSVTSLGTSLVSWPSKSPRISADSSGPEV